MKIHYDKEVNSVTGRGWRVGKSRLVIADGVGYAFTDKGKLARTFPAEKFAIARRRGRTADNTVSWNEWCGCGGRSVVPRELKATRAADLVAFALEVEG